MKRTDFRFSAIEVGSVADDPEDENEDERKGAAGGKKDCQGSLFTLIILSGKEKAIKWAANHTIEKVKPVSAQVPCFMFCASCGPRVGWGPNVVVRRRHRLDGP